MWHRTYDLNFRYDIRKTFIDSPEPSRIPIKKPIYFYRDILNCTVICSRTRHKLDINVAVYSPIQKRTIITVTKTLPNNLEKKKRKKKYSS